MAPRLLPLALCLAPLCFLVPFPRTARAPATARRAEAEEEDFSFSWDTPKPELPQSPEEMAQQAADAVMRAYRDGKTRQAMRLSHLASCTFMHFLWILFETGDGVIQGIHHSAASK